VNKRVNKIEKKVDGPTQMSRALIVAGDKSWIGISSFRHTPLGFYAETFFSLPRIEWYARLQAGFEHLAGH
jgi:hypothetical protein